jgi:flagellin-like hook-associated protein FlgL
MVVKNNMSAISTLNTLNKNQSALAKSLAQVSSGMKINSAKDDASGYAISERMRVMIRSLDQANENTQNASNMMKVAEDAVGKTVDILDTLKKKALQAATDTKTDEDRATIQKEINQLVDQIDDNALITYNGKYLLDGSKVQAGQATYATFTNQAFGEGTTGDTAITDLVNRKGETLGIIDTDYITASYVRNGQNYSTTFKVGSHTLHDIFSLMEEQEDEQQFADYTNSSVIGAIGETVTTTKNTGTAGKYTYDEIVSAKAKVDAEIAALEEKLQAAQGAVGANGSKGWSGIFSNGDSVTGSWDSDVMFASSTSATDGTYDPSVSDTGKVYGAAKNLAEALVQVEKLKGLVNPTEASDTTSTNFVGFVNLIGSSSTDTANVTIDATTDPPTAAILELWNVAQDNTDGNKWKTTDTAYAAWDGLSYDTTSGKFGAVVDDIINKMTSWISSYKSINSPTDAQTANYEKVDAALTQLMNARDAFLTAVDERDDIAEELNNLTKLQTALADNITALDYKAQAQDLHDDVTQIIRDHFELAANPTASGKDAVLTAGQAVGMMDISWNTLSNSINLPSLVFAPGTNDQSTAQFQDALYELADKVSERLFNFIEQSATLDDTVGSDATEVMTAFLQSFGSSDAGTVPPTAAWKVGASGTAGDLSDLLKDETDDATKAAAKWNALTDLASYGETWDNYLTYKKKADTETLDFNKAMDLYGGKVSSDIALIASKNIGLDTSGAVVTTPDGKEGITVTSNIAGLKGQISAITISVSDALGSVKKSANTALNAWKVSIFGANESKEDTSLKIHVGANANQSISIGLYDMRSEALGLKGSDGKIVDVSTISNANAAISVFDNALQKALDIQTTIGAIESRLDYTSDNLTTASENITASESTIRDADMAKAMTEYTKNNVLLQAAQSMLAQANQNSSAVLSLLQ